MKNVTFAVAGLAFALGTLALAEEAVTVSGASAEKAGGLNNAFELGIGAGLSQGVGDVGRGMPSLTDTGGAGAALELDLGWRIDPHFLPRRRLREQRMVLDRRRVGGCIQHLERDGGRSRQLPLPARREPGPLGRRRFRLAGILGEPPRRQGFSTRD